MKNLNDKNFSISKEEENLRLDHFLSKKTGLSRNRIQALVKDGCVLCNKKRVKSSYSLKEKDLIEVGLHTNENKKTELFHDDSIKLDVVFEDHDIIVVNKPAGLVTHPGAGLETQSVVHALFNKLPMNKEEPFRPGIVHRLDKDTQGLLVLAKNKDSQSNLALQFKEKTAKRTYRALCYGKFKKHQGTIETYLKRDPKNRKKYKSQEEGRLAITHYKLINENEISLIELYLETGRTHQIRVHLAENHHPIINDKIYGHEKRLKDIKDSKLKSFIKNLNNMPLVAIKLEIIHPRNNERMIFSIPWPNEFIYENLSD